MGRHGRRLDGNHAKIAVLQTPDGQGQVELVEYRHLEAIETEPTLPHEIGLHRVAFSVDDLGAALEVAAKHGCHPLRGIATYQDAYRLTSARTERDPRHARPGSEEGMRQAGLIITGVAGAAMGTSST